MSRRLLSLAAGLSLGIAVAFRSSLRIPVFEGTTPTAEPWLLTSIPPLGWLFVWMALGAGVGYYLPRKLAPAVLFSGVAALVLVPWAFEVAPFVAAFSGRFLDFVLVGVGLVVLFQIGRLPATLTVRRVGIVSLALFGLVSWKMSRDVGFSGDEPHYLLIAHSLVEDGDLRVQNNYGQEDHRFFYRGSIGPHLAAGTPYSVHGVGLPLVLVPGYALAGTAGVLATLVCLGSLVVVNLYRATRLLTSSHRAAVLAAAAFAMTSPGLFLSVSVYPELPAAAVVTTIFLRAFDPASATRWRAFAWSVLVGALPFLHTKFVPLALVLWAVLFFRFGEREQRLGVALGFVATGTLLVTFFAATIGSFDPTEAYGRRRVFLGSIPVGVLGLLFDQEFGLLIHAPVYLLGLTGVATLVRIRPLAALMTVAVLAAVALPGAAHPLWSGGSSPPARFLFPALPLLALGVGSLWTWERKAGFAPWLPALFAISLCVSAFTVLLPGQPLYLNARDGTGRLWEALSSSWDVTSYLPSIIKMDPRSLVVALVGLAVVVVAVMLQFLEQRLRLPAVGVVLLVAAWAQDLTGVARPRTQEGRWVSGYMRDLAEAKPSRFVAVPSFTPLDVDGVLERISLPLRPFRPDGDPRHWWSLPYAIPSGRYRASGVNVEGWAPCNDRNCFDVDGVRFDSAVALARFRVRARRLHDTPRLHFEEVRAATPVAFTSLAIAGGRRLHGLDDGAYLDRRGFWVKRAQRATFALEPGGELRLSNGGRDNVVLLRTDDGARRFALDPWEQARFSVSSSEGAALFSVESRSGFRPSDLDPESPDDRDLGVFVDAPPF